MLYTRYTCGAICPCGTRNGIYIISQTSVTSLYRNRAKRGYIAFCKAKYIAEKIKILDSKTIRELAMELTTEIVSICDSIKGRSVFVNQLLRSCSSIGANCHEAKYAQSDADFIHKLEIALKESYETEYWLEVLFRINSINDNTFKELKNKCGTIRRKLIASIDTVKRSLNKIREQ